MERMSSTEATAEEQRRWSTELQQRQWAARAAVFEGGDMQHRSSGGSPEPEAPDSPERQEVALTIGNADLEGLQVIEDIPPHRRITISAQRVSAHVPALLAPPHLLSRLNPAKLFRRRAAVSAEPSAKGPSHRQVLFGVSCCIRPGELLALMGPSGSGKTSLLSVIGARAQKTMLVDGSVLFNGHPLTKRLKRQVGYVMQDDLLYESLTVHETLHYAAALRLPRHMTAAQRAARVETVISALGLGACRDTIIGGFFRKGVSGGERKRTSIGHELLINPSALLLDEPTSGLDSTTAMHTLQILRHLAAGGRAVVTTIHQPSSRLYQQLDKMMMLSAGHVLYYGGAAGAVQWFSQLGYPCPFGVSVADFVLDLASGEVATPERGGEESRLHLITAAEEFLAGDTALDGFDPGSTPSSGQREDPPAVAPRMKGGLATIPSGQALNGSNGNIPGVAAEPSGASLGGAEEHRWGAPFASQVAILFRRSLRTRRFQSLSTQDFIQFIIIAVLGGCFWLQAGQDSSLVGARNTLGLLFFQVMFLSFRALFVALFTFPDEYKHMLKERASGMYRLSSFYIARTASDLPMDFAIPSLFLVILYFMGGLRYNAAAFFANYGTNMLCMLVAQSFGLLLGATVMDAKSAQTIASIIMLSFVLTGGFFVVSMPAWISWVKWLSYIYYGLGLLLHIQFDGGNAAVYRCIDPARDTCTLVSPSSPETNPNCTPVTDLKDSLGLEQDPSSQGDAIRDGFVLLGFLVFFRVCVYWALSRKTRGL